MKQIYLSLVCSRHHSFGALLCGPPELGVQLTEEHIICDVVQRVPGLSLRDGASSSVVREGQFSFELIHSERLRGTNIQLDPCLCFNPRHSNRNTVGRCVSRPGRRVFVEQTTREAERKFDKKQTKI